MCVQHHIDIDSSLLGCYAMSTDKQFLLLTSQQSVTFQTT